MHVVGGGGRRTHVPGPAPAAADATRAPVRTELFVETTSRIIRDISMMPRTRIMSNGVTMAASTATAPRSRRRIRATNVNTAAS